MVASIFPFSQPTRKVAWMKRDVLLFAASIGVEAENGLHFLYLSDTDTIDFLARNASNPLPPNCPALNWGTAVDAKRRLIFYKHIPPASGSDDKFEMRTRVLGVWDKRKATMMDLEHTLVKADSRKDEGDGVVKETVYTKSFETAFFVGAGGWGGPRGPRIARYLPPQKKADFETSFQTTAQSAHLYRLNGDYNPLHADPKVGQAMGYPGIIMHGLFSWNVAAVKILEHFAKNNEGTTLRDFQARFTAPVKPGDELDILMWEAGVVGGEECDEVFKGETLREIRFLVKVKDRVVLEDGRALLTIDDETGMDTKDKIMAML
ncbi:hypothetical protein KEM54_005922 [Ascosphaera aggregata]|nr:hypothetical protein KEM54_005922 [Ascosphaera aggregata]